MKTNELKQLRKEKAELLETMKNIHVKWSTGWISARDAMSEVFKIANAEPAADFGGPDTEEVRQFLQAWYGQPTYDGYWPEHFGHAFSGWCAARRVAAGASDRDKLLTIIAYAYQIVGAHNAPAHILDVLSDPEGATMEQVEAMLPYSPAAADAVRPECQAKPGEWSECQMRTIEAYKALQPPRPAADAGGLLAALQKIIDMNRQEAQDRYGDANKAETWACIRVAREAMAGYRPTAVGAPVLTAEQIAAGAAVLGDDGKPVGRNVAIMVADAMRLAGGQEGGAA